ncbi:MAG: hypothetical protein J2P21_06290 [Chloracidobacterium sp.]|nr:hypothetical protein [Chloracidobacterium sp.]
MTKKIVLHSIVSLALIIIAAQVSGRAFAQTAETLNPGKTACGGRQKKDAYASSEREAAAAALARRAFLALGGEAFGKLQSLKLSGFGEARSPLYPAALSVQFRLVATGKQISLQMASPIGLLQLINDGERQITMAGDHQAEGFGLGPQEKYGLWTLTRRSLPGYRISSLAGPGSSSFQITDPDCNVTNFEIYSDTGLPKQFDYAWKGQINVWQLADFKEVEGVLIPHAITVRMGSEVGEYSVELRVDKVEINAPVKPEAFKP